MSKIILINPGKRWVGAVTHVYPPVALLSVGGYLENKGFKVEIFDTRLEDFKKIDLNNATSVGITSLTGRQILHGLEVAKFVREKDPDIPIVWGGVHVSLTPQQALESKYVDIVVRKEGELAAADLFEKLENGKNIDNIFGISYKNNGKIIHNPERPFMDLDETYELPYHLLKMQDNYYPKEVFYYSSSRGCPHRCGFCYNLDYVKRRWRAKSVKKVLEEISWIISKFNPKAIAFYDDNFFVDKERVEEISKGLIDIGFDGVWAGDCRIDYFRRYDSSFLELIKKSGCDSLFFGVDSGSPRILKLIQKDYTVDQVVPTIEKCKKYGISLMAAFMTAFPTETKEDLMQTMSLIHKIMEVDKTAMTPIAMFTPFPGTPLFSLAVEHGFKPPSSLEKWGEINFSNIENDPWVNEKDRLFFETVTNTARFKNTKFSKQSISAVIKNIYILSANMRWKYDFFGFPIEWKLWKSIQKWRGYA